MIWNKKSIDSVQVKDMAAKYGLDALTASIFSRRGLTAPEELLYYFEDDFRFMHNPFYFEDMEEVVDRIHQAKYEGEKILVFGDRDVDGITSTTILVQALGQRELDVSWMVPMGDDSYGLTKEVIDTYAAQDVTLIITVDCGISNHAEIEYAAQLGIDTIVIDHHSAKDSLPPALAIINPKVPGSEYPFSGLAGVGVTSKVIWALNFGESDFYREPICLMNIRPGKGSFELEAVKLENLIEVDRIVENLVPGMVSLEQTRLVDFFRDQQILVYDGEVQKKMLAEIFGTGVEVGFIDISQEIWKIFPSTQYASLLKLREKSRSARYSSSGQMEIDVFLNLFISFAYRKVPGLIDAMQEVSDLVALGTVADLMPLKDENRILVKNGLKRLSVTQRPGLRNLLLQQNLYGRDITTKDLAWQISPIINSTGRLGSPDLAVKLFLSEDSAEIDKLTREVSGLNQKRKEIGDQAWAHVLPLAHQQFEFFNSKIVAVNHESIHRGITGILAARLSNAFNTPACVLAELEDRFVGSARSIPGLKILAVLENMKDMFEDFGGHDYAAGFNFPKSKLQSFYKRLKEEMAAFSTSDMPEESLDIDAELPAKYMTPELDSLVRRFEPYGESNPALNFMVKTALIEDAVLIGKREQNHIKLSLRIGSHLWPALYWGGAEGFGPRYNLKDRVDVVFNITRNYYQNQETLQLVIKDLKKCE